MTFQLSGPAKVSNWLSTYDPATDKPDNIFGGLHHSTQFLLQNQNVRGAGGVGGGGGDGKRREEEDWGHMYKVEN